MALIGSCGRPLGTTGWPLLATSADVAGPTAVTGRARTKYDVPGTSCPPSASVTASTRASYTPLTESAGSASQAPLRITETCCTLPLMSGPEKYRYTTMLVPPDSDADVEMVATSM